MIQKLHRTAKGKVIDMNKLANQNELEIAVSNAKINARGDELGAGGNIIRYIDPINDIPHAGLVAQHQPAPRVQPKPVVQETKQPKITPKIDTQPALVQPVSVATESSDNKSNNQKGKL